VAADMTKNILVLNVEEHCEAGDCTIHRELLLNAGHDFCARVLHPLEANCAGNGVRKFARTALHVARVGFFFPGGSFRLSILAPGRAEER
jgi:hypothetical protein